jgi:hypothetical protein
MRDGKFISVTDAKKGNILDSISLSVMQKTLTQVGLYAVPRTLTASKHPQEIPHL